METKLEVGRVLSRVGDLLRANLATALGTLVALVAVNVALDALMSESGSNFASGMGSLVAQYVVTRRALEQAGLIMPAGKPRFGAFWGLNLLSGLAILVGCVFLIVPGLYLAARWAAAGPILLAEETGVGAALSRSWAMTAGNLWSIIGILLVVFVPACVLGVGIGGVLIPVQPTLSSIILYTGMFGAFVISWYAAVAIYSLLAPPPDAELAEIFA